MELTYTTTPPQDTEEIVMEQPPEEKPQPSPVKASNVNVSTLMVEAMSELRVDIRTARALERIDVHNEWQRVFILLLVIEQFALLIAIGVLMAK